MVRVRAIDFAARSGRDIQRQLSWSLHLRMRNPHRQRRDFSAAEVGYANSILTGNIPS